MSVELSRSVQKLTGPWAIVVTVKGKYEAQDFPALISMLEELVAPNSGRTRGGVNDPATRSVVDVKALTLLMHIQDVIGAWSIELGNVPQTKNLTQQVATVAHWIETLWTSQALTERDYLRYQDTFDRWATQIWDLVEPPLQLPLKDSQCPECGRTKWVNDDGDMVDAILVSYREGGDVQAECRWGDCTGLWVGRGQLRRLGALIGSIPDEEALKEMGEGE